MKTLTEQQVFEKINEAAGQNYETRVYSGRFMDGEECLGVICDNVADALVNIVFDVVDACGTCCQDWTDENIRVAREFMTDVRMDNMGLEYVIYFPDVPYIGDGNEQDDDD